MSPFGGKKKKKKKEILPFLWRQEIVRSNFTRCLVFLLLLLPPLVVVLAVRQQLRVISGYHVLTLFLPPPFVPSSRLVLISRPRKKRKKTKLKLTLLGKRLENFLLSIPRDIHNKRQSLAPCSVCRSEGNNPSARGKEKGCKRDCRRRPSTMSFNKRERVVVCKSHQVTLGCVQLLSLLLFGKEREREREKTCILTPAVVVVV